MVTKRNLIVVWLTLGLISTYVVLVVAQDDEFTVHLGKDKVFTTYNSHWTELEVAPFHVGQGRPSILDATSIGQKASAQVLAESYQEGFAKSFVGVDFLVEPACKGLVTTMEAEVSIRLSYKLDVDFNVPPPSEYGGGSADTIVYGVIMGNETQLDRIHFIDYGNSDSRSGKRTLKLNLTLEAGKTYQVSAYVYAYGDVYISGYASSYAEVIVEQIKVAFEVPEWRRNLCPGDLVFYRSTGFNPLKLLRLYYTHVGIYVGEGEVIEAHGLPFPGEVRYQSIEVWDVQEAAAAYRVANATKEQIEGAIEFAKDQLGLPYYYWLANKDNNGLHLKCPQGFHCWYCSELAWAAFLAQGIHLEQHTSEAWAIPPDEIATDDDTHMIGNYIKGVTPGTGMAFQAHSPVNIIVKDPVGLRVDDSAIEIPGAYYVEYDLDGGGDEDSAIAIPEDMLKIGTYLINVTSKSSALPTDTYSLEVIKDGTTTGLAKDVPVSDIPSEPYEYRYAPSPTLAVFRVTTEGNVYADAAYYGANFLSGGADIAELIEVSESVEPGDVVALDPDNANYYRKSREPYSTLASGVISTQPGFTLGVDNSQWDHQSVNLSLLFNPRLVLKGISLANLSNPTANDIETCLRMDLTLETITQKSNSHRQKSLSNLSLTGLEDLLSQEYIEQALTGEPLLALMGVVPVKATTENGPIKPGDLLTTSSKPGYAMVCKDKEKCTGAIIGKALEPLEEGVGVIKMLVMR